MGVIDRACDLPVSYLLDVYNCFIEPATSFICSKIGPKRCQQGHGAYQFYLYIQNDYLDIYVQIVPTPDIPLEHSLVKCGFNDSFCSPYCFRQRQLWLLFS